MANKIKLEFTPRQLLSLVELTDTISSMTGVGTDFDDLDKEVVLIDRMLNSNGYSRNNN